MYLHDQSHTHTQTKSPILEVMCCVLILLILSKNHNLFQQSLEKKFCALDISYGGKNNQLGAKLT